jgi:hypothetical protein
MDVRPEILSVLSRRARFVAELARLVHADLSELDGALREMEADGTVLVREQYCADPHLDGTDLRIAAAVRDVSEGVDPVAHAIADIDAVWQHWLGEYLANHRCS